MARAQSIDNNIFNTTILSRPEEERRAGQQFRKEKSQAQRGQVSNDQAPMASLAKPQSLRQAMAFDRMKEKAKEKIKEKVAAPIKAASGALLRAGWKMMLSVWGFIFGLIIVNAIAFLHLLNNKLICGLGEEWVPKQMRDMMGETGEVAAKPVILLEKAGLAAIDLLTILAIILAISIIFMVFDLVIPDFLNWFTATTNQVSNTANAVVP